MVNSYIELLISPKFWILTVALGLTIGVAANFLTRFVERALGSSGARDAARIAKAPPRLCPVKNSGCVGAVRLASGWIS